MPELNDALKFSRCVDVFDKALLSVSSLLEQEIESLNYDDVHNAKSVLYAAIERLGTKAERIIYSQRLLRELFSIVSESCDLKLREKQAALQIIKELRSKYRNEI